MKVFAENKAENNDVASAAALDLAEPHCDLRLIVWLFTATSPLQLTFTTHRFLFTVFRERFLKSHRYSHTGKSYTNQR